MRFTLAALVGILFSLSGHQARADQYKWCAAYGGSEEGSYNCYFVTLAQCQAAVSGIGGFCIPSPYATTPPVTTQRKKKQS